MRLSKSKVRKWVRVTERIDRLLMFANQNERCFYCNCQMTVERKKTHGPNYATFDHVVARKHKSGAASTVLACRSCNELKGTMDAKQFKALIEGNPGVPVAALVHQFWDGRKQRRRSTVAARRSAG